MTMLNIGLPPPLTVDLIDRFQKECRWEVGRIPNDKVPTLEGTISLPSDHKIEERPTIRVEFVAKQHGCSGLTLDKVTIKGVKYKPFQGIRQVTKAGNFEVRC